MTEKKKDLVVFLDTVGRTIIAERLEEDDVTIRVQNPALVNIVPQQGQDPASGQPVQRMALQLFPLFFREFLAAKDEPVKFTYNKANVTMSDGDIALDFKVGIQYEQLFAAVGEITQAQPPVQAQPEAATQPEEKTNNVIQLFDDK